MSISDPDRNSSPALSAAPTSSAAGISATASSIAARSCCAAAPASRPRPETWRCRSACTTSRSLPRARRRWNPCRTRRPEGSCGNPISAPIAIISSRCATAPRPGLPPRCGSIFRSAAPCVCIFRRNTAVRWPADPPHKGKSMNRPLIGGVLAAILLLLTAAGTASAAAPQPTATMPELLAKAGDEKKIVWYTSIELQSAEKIAKQFESAHPGIDVQVERNGCEHIVQLIAQERSSNIHAADVVECSDMTALLDWK